jgi:hypothetical protein
VDIEEQILNEIHATPSDELFAQIRETLELSVDEYNHRADFAALNELAGRLKAHEAREDA